MTVERTCLFFISVFALHGLSACSGGGGATPAITASGDPAAYYSSTQAAQVAMERTVFGNAATGAPGYPNSAFKAIPTSGTATYKGFAQVDFYPTGEQIPTRTVLGNGTIAANFASNTMTGSYSNFTGTALDPAGNQLAGPAAYYAGTLNVANGCIGNAAGCANVTRPNQFSGALSGTLTGEGNTINIDHDFLGNFRGSPIVAVEALGVTNLTTINGTQVDSALYIIGQR